MSIKLEIPEYNTLAMKHLGRALVALSEDIEGLAQDVAPPAPMPVEAPPAPMPVEAPPAPMPVPTDSGLDVEGIPWDERIHATTKTRCKDNTWKLKPGMNLNDEVRQLVLNVKAELKGVQAIPTPETPPKITIISVTPGPDTVLDLVPPAPVEPVVIPAPPAPAPVATPPENFASMLKFVGDLITAGKMTAEDVNAACASHGLPKFNLLAGRPDLIPAVWSTICLTVG
jgi:hypothetical protein